MQPMWRQQLPLEPIQMVCHNILLYNSFVSIIFALFWLISHDDDDYNDYNEITFLNHSVNRAGDIVFYSVAFAIFEQLSDFIC